jgi:outer membrane protein
MQRFRAAALGALALSGCATSALDMVPPTPSTPWAPAVDTSGVIQPGPAATNSDSGYLLPPNLAVATLPSAPLIDPRRVYKLAALIDIAESNDPQTRIAWDQARQAALAAGIAESAYLPQIAASAVGAYQGSNGQSSALGTDVSGSNEAHGVISAVSLNWLLFDFGGRTATITAAKQLSIISNIAFTGAHQQLIYNVSLAFYAYAAARDRVSAAAQSLQNAGSVQAAAQALYTRGVGTIVDADQATQATAQARLALVQANGSAEDAYLTLLTAMGISPLTKLNVARPPRHPLPPGLNNPVQAIVAAALARRPDTLSAYAAEQASLANVEAARSAFMPKLFLSATGAYSASGLDISAIPAVGQQQGTFNLSGSHLNGTILAGIAVPLYDGGTRAAALAQAEAGADSASAKLDKARDEAARQVVAAANEVRTSVAAYDAAQALAAAAQTSYHAAIAAYRNGVGSVTVATLAETQLLQARQSATDTYCAALSAAANLAFTTGALGAAPE